MTFKHVKMKNKCTVLDGFGSLTSSPELHKDISRPVVAEDLYEIQCHQSYVAFLFNAAADQIFKSI